MARVFQLCMTAGKLCDTFWGSLASCITCSWFDCKDEGHASIQAATGAMAIADSKGDTALVTHPSVFHTCLLRVMGRGHFMVGSTRVLTV